MQKCPMPACREEATKLWSMVPVCNEHYQALKMETERYYTGKGDFYLNYDERNYFSAIKHLIPFQTRGKR